MTDCDSMTAPDWAIHWPGRCYFYPGRDCPGWHAGGICVRISSRIPNDAQQDGPGESG